MSIFNFTKKLLPRIDRSQVSEDLRVTEKEAVNVVVPSWEAAATYFKLNKPASQAFKDFNLRFYRSFDLRRGSKGLHFLQDIQKRLPAVVETITYLRGILDTELEKDILSSGLTLRKAFVLRSASNLSMVTRYLSSLLNYLYTAEAQHHDVQLEPGLEISKGDMAYIEKNFDRFVRLFSEYSQPTKDFKALVMNAPEMFVSPQNQEAIQGLYKGSDIDPFERYGVSGFIGNPIYRIRLVIAEWQNRRYESAKAKKQQLELRLLYLEMQGDKQTNPAVVEDIRRLQERIEGYDRYLREVEESLEEDR